MNLKYKKHEQNWSYHNQIAKASGKEKEKTLNSSCRKHRLVTDREKTKTERTAFVAEQYEQEDGRATSLKYKKEGVNLKFYT